MILLGTQLFVALGNFIAFYFIAHGMGARAVGLVGYALGIVGVFSFITDLGLRDAAAKLIGDGRDTPRRIGSFLALRAVLTVVLVVAVVGWVLLRPSANGETPADHAVLSRIVLITLVGQVFITISDCAESVLTSLRLTARQVVSAWAGLVDVPIRIVVGLRNLGAPALAGANSIGSASSAATSLWTLRDIEMARPTRASVVEYLRFVAPITVAVTVGIVAKNMDSVILGWAKGAVEVGLLYGSIRILSYIDLISMSIMKVIYPDIALAGAAGDSAQIRHLMTQSYRQIGFVLVPLIMLLMVGSRDVIRLVLGPDFRAATSIFIVIAASTLVDGLSRVSGFALVASGQRVTYSTAAILSSATRTILGLLLIPSVLVGVPLAGLGALGAAFAILISRTVLAVQYMYACRHMSGAEFLKPVAWQLGTAAAVGVAAATLRGSNQSLVAGGIEAVAAGLSYVAILAVAGQLSRADLKRYQSLMRFGAVAGYVRSELKTRRPAPAPPVE
ncbi:MAG TPA: oligosaccharide flippase family protein [Gemmatimonadaceae bacterium]|jgi:O-antigen/teichoic acid export membrane protein